MFPSGSVQKPLAIPGPGAAALYSTVLAAVVGLRLAVKKYKLFPTILALSLGLQISALVVVPVVVLVVRWRNRNKAGEERAFQRDAIHIPGLPSLTTVVGAGTMLIGIWILSAAMAEIELWRLAAVLECLAFLALGVRVTVSRNVAGISVRKLTLDALRLGCRLLAMAWLDRLLPRRSADGLVQLLDTVSFVMVLILVYCAKVTLRGSYQRDSDVFPIRGLALASFTVACVLRASISQNPVPDAMWTASLYLDATSVLPQLALIAQNGGTVDAGVGHHVAGLFTSRLLGLAFWWSIRGTWHGGRAAAGWGILVVYSGQLVLLSHYMCYYFKGCFTGGLLAGSPMVCAE